MKVMDISTKEQLQDYLQKMLREGCTGDDMPKLLKAFEKRAEETEGIRKEVNEALVDGFKRALGKV